MSANSSTFMPKPSAVDCRKYPLPAEHWVFSLKSLTRLSFRTMSSGGYKNFASAAQSRGRPRLDAGQVYALLRFVGSLETHSNPERLLHSLPAQLGSLVVSDTIALVFENDGTLFLYGVDSGEPAIGAQPAMADWQTEIDRLASHDSQPVVVSWLDQETTLRHIAQFFSERGHRSLCLLSLKTAKRRLGALRFARKPRVSFSGREIAFLSLISRYVALAIDDQLNFANSEAVRIQLEEERTKLNLILDLITALSPIWNCEKCFAQSLPTSERR